MIIQCTNCGSMWQRADTRVNACPVCALAYAPTTKKPAPIASISMLEAQLDALIRHARASGLDRKAIARVLSAELAFATEVSQAGRRFVVQVIDVGPQDAVQRPFPKSTLPKQRP